MQLAALGPLDEYLSGNPEASLFAYDYKKIPNHATSVEALNFDGNPDFGRIFRLTFPMRGDLLHDVMLVIQLPPLVPGIGSTFAGWTNCTAYAIIDTIDLVVGDTVVDRKGSLDLEIFDYLTTPAGVRAARDKQVGRFDNVNVLPQNALGVTTLIVPIPYSFTKKMAASLPMLSLYHQTVTLRVRFKEFEKVVTYDGPAPPRQVSPLSVSVLAEYVHLASIDKQSYPMYALLPGMTPEDEVKESFFLIEQVQSQVDAISAGTTSRRIELDFRRCVKEIVFVIVEDASEDNNDFFNYGRRLEGLAGGEFIVKAGLSFDNQERFPSLPEAYWRLRGCEKYHSQAGLRNIYCISFATSPELTHQPSGTANLSRFDAVTLNLDFVDNVPNCKVHTFAVSYNIMRIGAGYANLEFVN